jgi:hypothetical protein
LKICPTPRAATVKEILTVQEEGVRDVARKLEYYNLDVIIAVGYRVNSMQACTGCLAHPSAFF